MARIAGINIPMNKHVVIGLTHIFGVGNSRAARICDAAGVKYNVKVKDLTDAEVASLRSQVANGTADISVEISNVATPIPLTGQKRDGHWMDTAQVLKR